MLVQNMPSLAVAMVVAREKNIEKKSIFLKFHETSKYHIFRKSIFSSCLKMFIDFFKDLTDISKCWNLNKKICNNHKLLRFEIQNNQKFQPFQKLQVLNACKYKTFEHIEVESCTRLGFEKPERPRLSSLTCLEVMCI